MEQVFHYIALCLFDLQVKEGLDALFFNVVVLGVLQTPRGIVWHKNPWDLVIIELTEVHGTSQVLRCFFSNS